MPTTATSSTQTTSCSACRYWDSQDGAIGSCRRHSPQAVVFDVDSGTSFRSVFPESRAEDWCGEFAAK